MKISITLSKNNDKTNPLLAVSYNDHVQQFIMGSLCNKIEFDVLPQPGSLRISRKEPMIGTSHLTYVYIDKIVLDEFWEINSGNDPGHTEYDEEYIDAAINKGATWELTKKRHNNVLFFNGSIRYDIIFPLRSMFWL